MRGDELSGSPRSGSVVVVGEALVDLVISPDGRVESALGGAPFNTARTVARLGVPVAFVGALSDDRFGSLLRARLLDDGVDTAMITSVDRPTTLAAAEVDERGAATYRFYLDGTSAPALGRVPTLADDVVAVHTGGLALVLEPMADAVAAMVASIGRRPTARRPMAVVDVNARPHVIEDRPRYLERLADILATIDVVKVSDDDLAVLAPGVAPAVAAEQLLDRGPSVVLLTAGADHVVVLYRAPSSGGAVTRVVPVPDVEVVDTIGAGDAFGGGFVAWWAATGRGRADLDDGDALEAAVRAAVTVAGITCTRRGADPPRRDELGDGSGTAWPST